MNAPRCLTSGCLVLAAACVPASGGPGTAPDADQPDTLAIAVLARALSDDELRGRGPWTAENAAVARRLATALERVGARPALGRSVLVPFAADVRPGDTVHNVIGVIPARDGSIDGPLVAVTAHFDGLGVGRADSTGDTIYNGFLDAAVPVAIVLDVARRYAARPGERPLAVMLFNLEEQGLLGSRALAGDPRAAPFIDRLALLIGVDAGAPAGEALDWQVMGALPAHPGAALADSLARDRGWTTTSTAPRAISDVYVFSQRGVPILFPIPGATWRGYTSDERSAAMLRFDRYHQPGDEWRPDFPWIGTWTYADWLWDIVRVAASSEWTRHHER